MKKSRLLVLPAIFVLVACKEVSIGFTMEEHEKGWDNSIDQTSQRTKVDSYSYRNNDVLDNSGLTAATMTFQNITRSETNVKDVDIIQSYINVDKEIFDYAYAPLYFSTKEEGFAFLGVDSTYVDGEITFCFTEDIKNVEITAKQYSYVKTSFNEDQLIVDADVAISVNNSGFIKVNGEAHEDTQTVDSTVCAFKLAEPTKSINIKVGQYRAILEKIVLYY